MTDQTTSPADGEAMSGVVDDLMIESEGLDPNEGSQDDAGDEFEEGDEPSEDLVDVEFEGRQYQLPTSVKDALLRQADYTQKTQAIAEQRKVIETRQAAMDKVAERQTIFAQDIAQLGALNARLQPYQSIQDWPGYLRQAAQRGPEYAAQAHGDYAEYQALTQQRDAFGRELGQKVQQRDQDAQREAAKQVEAGRAELAKHIKGYGPDTLSKLETFAAPFGFSPEEIRQAEADPRSIRILHLAEIGHRALQAQKRTSTLAQAQKTKPVSTLRGAGGRIVARPDTDDFSAFEKMLESKAQRASR